MLELKQLQFYLACVECGSLGKAAERLYTTQPNVSKVIHALESELGAELFERTPKGMILTPYGKAIYEYAQTCVQNAEALQSMKRQADTFYIATYRSHTLSRLLAKLYREHPAMTIEHQQGTADEILYKVQRGISEIGVLYIAKRHYTAFLNVLHRKKLEFHLLGYRDTCVYAGPLCPLYDRAAITFEELSRMKFTRTLNDTFSIQDGLEHMELGLLNPQQVHAVIRTNSEYLVDSMLRDTDVMDIGIHLDYPGEEESEIRAISIEGENSRAALGIVIASGHTLSLHAETFVADLSQMFGLNAWADTVPE